MIDLRDECRSIDAKAWERLSRSPRLPVPSIVAGSPVQADDGGQIAASSIVGR